MRKLPLTVLQNSVETVVQRNREELEELRNKKIEIEERIIKVETSLRVQQGLLNAIASIHMSMPNETLIYHIDY